MTNTPKVIIYLDQAVISNIAKVLDPDFPRRERLLETEPVWLEIYKKLDRLLKLQLIVCPQSYFHRTESMISTGIAFDSLRDVYSYLSNGCRFVDQTAILGLQLQCHFRDYVNGQPEREPVVPLGLVMSGRSPDEWPDRWRAVVLDRPDPSEIARIRAQREERHKVIERAFPLWQQEREPYSLAIKEEARSLGREIIAGPFSYLKKLFNPERPTSHLDLLPPPSMVMITALTSILDENCDSPDSEGSFRKICEYLDSEHLLRVPFVGLSARLYVEIARQAALGRKRVPSKGTTTDVMAIAALLPYCDAMFLDNEMRGYLMTPPLKEEVARFGTKIFSRNSMKQFLAYLDEIEASAEERHISCVKRVYGEENVDSPFMDVIVQGKKRRERRQG